MTTEVDSGSHSVIFTFVNRYVLHSENSSVKTLPRLFVLGNEAENINNN